MTEPREEPAGHDPAQVERAADAAPRLIQLRADAGAPQRRIGEDLRAIERPSLGIVRAEGAVAGDFLPGVVLAEVVPLHDERTGRTDESLADVRHHLALGKDLDLAFELFPAPAANGGIDAILRLDDSRHILEPRMSENQ